MRAGRRAYPAVVVEAAEVQAACVRARAEVFRWSRCIEAMATPIVYPGAEVQDRRRPGTAPKVNVTHLLPGAVRACANAVESCVKSPIDAAALRAFGPGSCMRDLPGWQRLRFQAWQQLQTSPAFQALTRDLLDWGIWTAAPAFADPDA